MARAKIPAQTPIVPRDIFLPLDFIYQYLRAADGELDALAGNRLNQSASKVTDAVLAEDLTLRVQVREQNKVSLQFLLFCTGNTKLRLLGPAGADLVNFSVIVQDSTGFTSYFLTAYSGVDIVIPLDSWLQISGLVHNGTTVGYVGLHWAQNASNIVPSVIHAGSILRYSLIAD
jgi:hypothetical protein